VTHRLVRIQALILSATTLAVALAIGSGRGRPLGVALGGTAALLDFVLVQHLVKLAFARRPSAAWAVALALAKSLILVAVPALALLLPASLIDGASFAVGVSALPLAVVVDAVMPLPERGDP
jgi:hypothetical protein